MLSQSGEDFSTLIIGQLGLNSMLRRGYKYGFCENCMFLKNNVSNRHDIVQYYIESVSLYMHIIPKLKEFSMNLRSKGHSFELPQYQYELFRKSFVPRSLFAYKIVNVIS